MAEEALRPMAWVAQAVLAAGARRSWPAGEADRWSALAAVVVADQATLTDDPLDGLDAVALLFDLDASELRLLAVAVAAHLSATLGQAYGALTGRAGAAVPTAGLALELAGLGSADPVGHAALGPDGPLIRHGLLAARGVDRPLLARDLVVPDRLVAHLVGAGASSREVARLAADVLPLPGATASAIASALASGADLIWVRDRLGASGAPVAVAAFASLGVSAFCVDLRHVTVTADLVDAVVLDAALAGHGLVLLGADAVPAAAWTALADAPVPVVAVGTGQWDTARLPTAPLVVIAPPVTPADRELLWRAVTADSFDVSSLTPLQLSPEEILLAVRYAAGPANDDAPLSAGSIRRAVAELAEGASREGRRWGGLRATQPASFADLVVSPAVGDELRRFVRWARHRSAVLARGPVQGVGGRSGGIAALFAGPPGTGKTLAAHVVASELGLELMHVDVSTVVDKYIGETEKNLERTFHEAESREVVLLFDEADALFGSRSDVKDARDRYANQEISYLLQRLERFDGVTILTTNLRGNLDAAFTRRMQFILSFGEPDLATRADLLRALLRSAGEQDPADPVDVDVLAAQAELSGGYLRNIVMAATYDAVSAGDDVGMRHLAAAAAREHVKLGRRVPPVLDALAHRAEPPV